MRQRAGSGANARRTIDALMVLTALAGAGIVGAMAYVLRRPGEWTAVVIIVDSIALLTAAFVLLLGWALRRALDRVERLPWVGIALWALVGVAPIIVFAVAHVSKLVRSIG